MAPNPKVSKKFFRKKAPYGNIWFLTLCKEEVDAFNWFPNYFWNHPMIGSNNLPSESNFEVSIKKFFKNFRQEVRLRYTRTFIFLASKVTGKKALKPFPSKALKAFPSEASHWMHFKSLPIETARDSEWREPTEGSTTMHWPWQHRL